jgi:hypothetical protein
LYAVLMVLLASSWERVKSVCSILPPSFANSVSKRMFYPTERNLGKCSLIDIRKTEATKTDFVFL